MCCIKSPDQLGVFERIGKPSVAHCQRKQRISLDVAYTKVLLPDSTGHLTKREAIFESLILVLYTCYFMWVKT